MKTPTLTTSPSSPTSTPTKKRARVSFATVEVRSYPMILDDTRYRNPYLTIGWESFETTIHELEEETGSMAAGAARPLAPKQRLFILLRAGCSPQSLREHLSKPDPALEQPIVKGLCTERKVEPQQRSQQPEKDFSKINPFRKHSVAAVAC